MGHTPESVSYSTPNSPTTPGAPIKDESRRPSFDAVSATSSTHHEVSSQGRRGAKKPRSVVNMTQEQRNRKRENGKKPSHFISPLFFISFFLFLFFIFYLRYLPSSAREEVTAPSISSYSNLWMYPPSSFGTRPRLMQCFGISRHRHHSPVMA